MGGECEGGKVALIKADGGRVGTEGCVEQREGERGFRRKKRPGRSSGVWGWVHAGLFARLSSGRIDQGREEGG